VSDSRRHVRGLGRWPALSYRVIREDRCRHLIACESGVTASARGCEECLKIGAWSASSHLSAVGSCGCCDESPGKHATGHFHATGHPIIERYDPPEGWGWCYDDETLVELAGPNTPARSDPAVRAMSPSRLHRLALAMMAECQAIRMTDPRKRFRSCRRSDRRRARRNRVPKVAFQAIRLQFAEKESGRAHPIDLRKQIF
jgi:hypothetical protein